MTQSPPAIPPFRGHAFVNGLRGSRTMWRILALIWGAILLIAAGFVATRTIFPELGINALFVPAVALFAAAAIWQIRQKKSIRPAAINALDNDLRQMTFWQHAGFFVHIVTIFGPLSFGLPMWLLMSYYDHSISPDFPGIPLGITAINIFYAGWFMGFCAATIKYAELFAEKRIKYAIYAGLILLLVML